MNVLELALAILLVLGNAFFVGAEFALVSVRRSQVEPLAEAGDRRAAIVVRALEDVTAMMAAAQLGITVCSLLLGALAEPALAGLLAGPFHALGVPEQLVHPISYVLALAVVVALHMVIGEMVPKNIALATPERAALVLGPPLAAIARTLRPFIGFLNACAELLLRLIRVESKDEIDAAYTSEQLGHLINDSYAAGLLAGHAQERLEDALELGLRPVREVVMPMDRLVTVDRTVTAEGLEELAVRTGYSRFPVVGDSIGDPVGDSVGDEPSPGFLGYLHVKDVLDLEERDATVPQRLWRPILTLCGDLPLDDALGQMRHSAAHLAGVVDAEGRTLGLVALEDVLEELVGEVHDPDHRATR
ncbi:hemolysin family protein [Streptacidiphilus fuscans]|uniref:HlyC/CorC family transporter n=1 Tax=Streptacidiphilus fuscans TaxID=2789292 RepID=A0A931BA52_9ACTN|nr:hemolysin family protein [Streptacidiphilus fuscans]MBF9068920.1 HlyC/CorC family transporter [Streptacidiphilus fuscans]MBF9073374.1 HlyC/CorC family transporter [Streptacidiphilus fuscans]